MSYRTLPPTFTADLLKQLPANQFVIVSLMYSMEEVAKRIAGGAADDLSGWEVIMEKIRALPPSPTDKLTWAQILLSTVELHKIIVAEKEGRLTREEARRIIRKPGRIEFDATKVKPASGDRDAK